MTRSEMAKTIEEIGDKIMEGSVRVADGDTLYRVAFALRTPAQNASEYARLLGEKGGSVKTAKKAASSRKNGKLGGRPKAMYRVDVDGDESKKFSNNQAAVSSTARGGRGFGSSGR